MGERYPAEITIGGKVPAGLLEEFLGELNSAGARAGSYEGDPFEAKDADELRQSLDEKGHLVLADTEASYGQFDGLEAFCAKHGTPFDRHSDAHYEFDAVNVRFRPGMESELSLCSNNRSEDLTDVDKIRPITKELARLAEAELGHEEFLAAVAKASGELAEALPPEVEPLPPLEIVEDEPIGFRNHYKCPRCGEEWTDEWSCACNDECSQCGMKDIMPTQSEDIT